MKKAAKAIGITLPLIVAVTLVSLRLLGYEPRDQRPGLWLTGDRVTEPVTDWSFTEGHQEIFVQTRTPYLMPHSVTTYCTVYDGDLYLFSAYYQGGVFPDDRAWNRNVMRDPRVRLKIGDRLFDQTVSHVTDADTRAAVHASAVAKYPEWSSPGLENVHILLVEG
ncbi:MAG: nitroreductase family deazaflavin-dependent oxidoreductase [Gemmatimonadetes bacterium]|nr:nitroreductase family deazaflavin-dependent oxidoreductase [Gemmatimonadota bacterium]